MASGCDNGIPSKRFIGTQPIKFYNDSTWTIRAINENISSYGNWYGSIDDGAEVYMVETSPDSCKLFLTDTSIFKIAGNNLIYEYVR